MSINWDSIEKKIDDYMKSDAGKERVRGAVKESVFGKNAEVSLSLPGVAAKKFLECLREAERNIVFTDSVRAWIALGTHGYEIEEGSDGKSFVVNIIPHEEDRSRRSVAPDRYPSGVYDIFVLLDQGYHANRPIRGMWHGKRIKTRADFDGYHFVDSAIKNFNNKYRKQLGVKRIKKPVFNRSWDEEEYE